MRTTRPLAVMALLALTFSLTITVAQPAAAASSTAAAVLAELTVRSETQTTTYDRANFRHWIDADSDGCNTRYEVLIDEATTKPSVSSSGCYLSGGAWSSKFDGTTTTDPSSFDVDHMVPLAEAWRSGAHTWTSTQREQFANDLGVDYSLIAVSASSNRSKSDRDPAEWMPPANAYHCTYATEWVLVKYRWGLSVDASEKSALSTYLSGSCGSKAVTLPTKMVSGSGGGYSFTDINDDSQFRAEITWLAEEGISTGYSDGTFRPFSPVTRDAMAAFMYRLAGEPSFNPPAKSPFKDVKPGSGFYKEITWLASTGVTTGYSDGEYKPFRPVTRDAMAAFMYRLAGEPSYRAPARSPFEDIRTSGGFYKEITWLADEGVSTGWSDGTFRPFSSITRDAMAAFMYRFDDTVGVGVGTGGGGGAVPPNPGDTKNCGDFSRWSDAQEWHDRYYRHYGDVGRLDADGDGVVCESLPGAP
ncbi:S-layer homology domain-containing protein [Demequina sp. SO4-13]|uniref:S-layer homology domain-containing protein n=1 Tax=Demequina sp. SO4-13 TaxID=3401027 RepID=UPI003AF98EB4